eukprot:5715137-Amphidinium_carterae.1
MRTSPRTIVKAISSRYGARARVFIILDLPRCPEMIIEVLWRAPAPRTDAFGAFPLQPLVYLSCVPPEEDHWGTNWACYQCARQTAQGAWIRNNCNCLLCRHRVCRQHARIPLGQGYLPEARHNRLKHFTVCGYHQSCQPRRLEPVTGLLAQGHDAIAVQETFLVREEPARAHF